MSNMYRETRDRFGVWMQANALLLQTAIWKACGEPPVEPNTIGLVANPFSDMYVEFFKINPSTQARNAFMEMTPYAPKIFVLWEARIPEQAPTTLMQMVDGVEMCLTLVHMVNDKVVLTD